MNTKLESKKSRDEPTQGLLEDVLLLSHEIINDSAPGLESGRRGLEESPVDEELKDVATPSPSGKLVRAQNRHHLTRCVVVESVANATKEIMEARRWIDS